MLRKEWKDLTLGLVSHGMMNMTTFEVEVKVPIESVEIMQNALLEIGGRKLQTETQTDTYYNHPCRSFPDTDEALRLRSRKTHSDSHSDEKALSFELTYKGPRVDPLSKTRLELEVGLEDPISANAILEQLDFKKVTEVIKTRTFYDIFGTTVSIDEVQDVGLFLELERVVHDESKIEETRGTIFDILRKLDIDPSTAIRTSYLELYLEKKSS